MRLVGDHHHVAALGQRLGHLAELLQGREDHAARSTVQQALQIFATAGLHGRLADQVAAHGKRGKQLVVEIIAIGQYHQRRVLHGGVLHQLAGIERHQQALA